MWHLVILAGYDLSREDDTWSPTAFALNCFVDSYFPEKKRRGATCPGQRGCTSVTRAWVGACRDSRAVVPTCFILAEDIVYDRAQ